MADGKHYQVNKDGTGQLVRETVDLPGGQDILEVLDALIVMATDLRAAAEGIPGYAKYLTAPEGEPSRAIIPAEKFDASTRLAFVTAGNALDYALRLIEDIGRRERINDYRAKLAAEMRRAGLEGDPTPRVEDTEKGGA
jgi:hypothetical protein